MKNWSVIMMRLFSFIFVFFAVTGCATTGEPKPLEKNEFYKSDLPNDCRYVELLRVDLVNGRRKAVLRCYR